MSVERARGYHSADRILHVDEYGDPVEPLGGYIPMQRLVGTAAIREAAEHWLSTHPPFEEATREAFPPKEDNEPDVTGLEVNEIDTDEEGVAGLTKRAIELAA